MTQHRPRHGAPALGRQPGVRLLGSLQRLVQGAHAGGPLCPRLAHHHCADGDPAVGRRVRVHGAALESRDAKLSAAVVQDIAALDRNLPELSAGHRPERAQADRAGAARTVVDFLPLTEMPPPGPKPFFSLLDQALSERNAQADRPAVLDRHRRALGAGRDPHPARQQRDARVRAAQRRLRVELGDLPALDGRHVAGAADRRDPVPAQSDQADPAAGRRSRELRQGPRGAELPAARRPRSAPRRAGLHRDEAAHRARDRTAHRDARRRVA